VIIEFCDSEGYPYKLEIFWKNPVSDMFPKGLDAVLATPHSGPHTTVRHYPILLGLEGPLQGHRFILNKQMVTIGRDMLADIVLRDGKAARVHARVTYANIVQRDEAPQCRIYDAGSETGTFVNQQQVGVSGQLLTDQDHVQLGRTVFGFYIRDDEQNSETHQPLDVAAANDPETGLLYHRVFGRIYPREFERARRYQRELSLLLLSVENLAQIKDRYGNPARIAVLRRVGQILQKSFRSSDVVARHDTADIVALLPETSLENAVLAANRI